MHPSSSTAKTPFFVDTTPLDNNEYVPSGHPAHYNAIAGDAVGNWDLLSVVVHELGHALGFGTVFDRFASRSLPTGGSSYVYYGEDFTVELANAGHIDDGYDLMGYPGFWSSERALPSPVDTGILNDSFDYTDSMISQFGHGPIAIPDQAISRFYLDVPEDVVVEDLDVAARIDHTFLPDLDISLISPAGTRVELSSGNGLPGTGYGFDTLWTRFDDESIAFDVVDYGTLVGTFSPENPLSAFDGESSSGTWILEIADNYALDSARASRTSP